MNTVSTSECLTKACDHGLWTGRIHKLASPPRLWNGHRRNPADGLSNQNRRPHQLGGKDRGVRLARRISAMPTAMNHAHNRTP